MPSLLDTPSAIPTLAIRKTLTGKSPEFVAGALYLLAELIDTNEVWWSGKDAETRDEFRATKMAVEAEARRMGLL